tara:strand:- start:1221 stop:2228 length:1008 start_codon:yes stop_codon:yes gene_type:complete
MGQKMNKSINLFDSLKKKRSVQLIFSYFLKYIDVIFIPFQIILKQVSSFKIFRIIMFRLLPLDKEILVSTTYGKYLINTNDRIISKKIFINQEPYESKKVLEVLRLLKENNLAISNLVEVGANIGSVTITFLLFDKNLTATAIEGNIYSKSYLDANIYINNLTQRCKSVMSLIGESTKDVFFVTFQGESGNSMVFDTLNKNSIEKYSKKMNLNIKNIEKRKVSTLTELDEIPIINRRTLIWLDIEGYEYFVLNGVKDLTAKPIIVFEINPALVSSTQKSPNLFIKNFEDLFIKYSYSNAILLNKRCNNFKVRSGFLNDICNEISYSNAHGDILIY